MEIWESKPPGTLWATPDLLRDSFTFTLPNKKINLDRSSAFHLSKIVLRSGLIRGLCADAHTSTTQCNTSFSSPFVWTTNATVRLITPKTSYKQSNLCHSWWKFIYHTTWYHVPRDNKINFHHHETSVFSQTASLYFTWCTSKMASEILFFTLRDLQVNSQKWGCKGQWWVDVYF